MISSLKIEGYRCFEHFEMSGLGRVNLLVGKNNSGKTSVLEAIYLLMSQGHPVSIWHLLLQRGEVLIFDAPTPSSPSGTQLELDGSNLFTGRRVRVGSRVFLSAVGESLSRHLTFTVASRRVNGTSQSSGLALEIEGDPAPLADNAELSSAGGISLQWVAGFREPLSPDVYDHRSPLCQSAFRILGQACADPRRGSGAEGPSFHRSGH